jgi:hypothetical protein
MDDVFASTGQWVRRLRANGLDPETITHQIVGAYYDMEFLIAMGPVIRNHAITLAKAMVRQALELPMRVPGCPVRPRLRPELARQRKAPRRPYFLLHLH